MNTAPRTRVSLLQRGLSAAAITSLAGVVALGLVGCNAKSTSPPAQIVFGDVLPLSASDVSTIISRAVAAIASNDLHVAVVSRTGDILGVYSTAGGTITDADNIAVGLARTTAFFSNSQAPLSSRTVETLSTYHFPPTFGATFDDPFLETPLPVSTGAGPFPDTVVADNRRTTGVAGTPQGPLWNIQATNRGAAITTNLTTPATLFNADRVYFPSRNINGSVLTGLGGFNGGTFPSPGIVSLPGAVPLFKANSSGVLRLVGGVGVYVGNTPADPDVAAAEFAAIVGAGFGATNAPGDEKFFFDAIPLEGAITILGVLLPYVQQTTRPAGSAPGVFPSPGGAFLRSPVDGRADPFGFLIGPRAGVNGFGGQLLTQDDVETIIDQVIASADRTRAQVRLPLGSAAKVIATVVDTRGLILAHFRMEDTLCDAVDVVPAKARSVVYYCQPSSAPTSAFANGDTWPGFPTGDARGIALTTRTLGFLSQPFYPPGIDGTSPGPLFALAEQNRQPAQVDRWGSAPPDPGYQNGLTFFPGSVPLYKNGQLVGALGVSGDGVEQNDLIAFDGGRGFEPPPELRIENFEFNGVRLPYLKFPQTPR
jgi:uncharacterized protein GlcG (DUF336 family)